MIRVKFKNLIKSEMLREIVQERLGMITDKFPDLDESALIVTLEMENSPYQAGPDLFNVKVHITRGRYRGVIVVKSASKIYVALADVVDHMLEKLNRFGDRNRVRSRNNARQFIRKLEMKKAI